MQFKFSSNCLITPGETRCPPLQAGGKFLENQPRDSAVPGSAGLGSMKFLTMQCATWPNVDHFFIQRLCTWNIGNPEERGCHLRSEWRVWLSTGTIRSSISAFNEWPNIGTERFPRYWMIEETIGFSWTGPDFTKLSGMLYCTTVRYAVTGQTSWTRWRVEDLQRFSMTGQLHLNGSKDVQIFNTRPRTLTNQQPKTNVG